MSFKGKVNKPGITIIKTIGSPYQKTRMTLRYLSLTKSLKVIRLLVVREHLSSVNLNVLRYINARVLIIVKVGGLKKTKPNPANETNV